MFIKQLTWRQLYHGLTLIMKLLNSHLQLHIEQKLTLPNFGLIFFKKRLEFLEGYLQITSQKYSQTRKSPKVLDIEDTQVFNEGNILLLSVGKNILIIQFLGIILNINRARELTIWKLRMKKGLQMNYRIRLYPY